MATRRGDRIGGGRSRPHDSSSQPPSPRARAWRWAWLSVIGFTVVLLLIPGARLGLASIPAGTAPPIPSNIGWAAPPAVSAPAWSVIGVAAPSARYDAKSVYDAADRYVVLFGGYGCSGSCGDTWTLSQGKWTHLTPAVSPSPRGAFSLTYDAKDGYVLLFGGFNSSYLNDTWSFRGGAWTQIHPSSAPSPRADASMAYDAKDGYVVLFQGEGCCLGSGGWLNDSWRYVNGSWSPLRASPAPSPRGYSALAYDAKDGYLVEFGGKTTAGYTNDTWIFVHGKWRNITDPVHPTARFGVSLAYDSAAGAVLLFGGAGNTGFDSDTWWFSNGSWTGANATVSPTGRQYAATSYDTADMRTYLFGGYGGSSSIGGETWEYPLGPAGWRQIDATPPARLGAAMAWDAVDHYGLMFGGCTNTVCSGSMNSETWMFANSQWTSLTSLLTTAPPARAFPQMAYDPIDREIVMYGGLTLTTHSTTKVASDTWVFAHGQWKNLSATLSTSPGALYRGVMAYDASDHYLLLFGGTHAYLSAPAPITWKFAHQHWTNLTAKVVGAPPGLYRAAMAYDSLDRYVVLFGGCSARVCPGGATYTYHNQTWTNLTANLTVAPTTRIYPVLADDPHLSGVVLFGGATSVTGPTANDTWLFSRGVWKNLNLTPTPGGRYGAAAAVEPYNGALVVFGGWATTTTGAATMLADTWRLT